MKPGRELDNVVAEAMGQKGRIALPYSTDMGAAWKAWEWLEQSFWDQIALGRDGKGQPCILELLSPKSVNFPNSWGVEEIAIGETYPHAICLAILEATKK